MLGTIHAAGACKTPNRLDSEVSLIAQFAALATYEISARDNSGLAKAVGLIPAETKIFISWMPGDTDEQRLAMAAELRKQGLVPVPHIAARRVRSKQAFVSHLEALVGEARVDTVLLIGGDCEDLGGPYGDVAQLMEDIDLGAMGVKSIGLAGHPEGHPSIGRPVLDAALDRKLELAAAMGVDSFIATQFVFSAAPMIEWLRRLRSRWPSVAVRTGLAGPASLRTLLRFATVCGVGNSLQALTRHGTSIARMLTVCGPDVVMRDLAAACAHGGLGPVMPHVFCFGGLARTVGWIAPVAAGRFSLDADQQAQFRFLEDW